MRLLATTLVMAAMTTIPAIADHLEVQEGSVIAVRTNERIDSESARAGQTFDAEIAEAVTARGGEVIIPRGAPAKLVLLDFEKGGAVGTHELVLDLQSVRVDGRTYHVGATTDVGSDKSGLGANRRTATHVGGGAALGALIGAIAGGGRGAAIGGLAGAGAGAAAQVLTRGDKVRVPAETVLRFKLEQPLRLDTR